MRIRRFLDAPRDKDGEGRFLTGSVLLLLLLLISALLHMTIDDYRHYSSFNAVFEREATTASHAPGERVRSLDDSTFVMDGFKEFILARDEAKPRASQMKSSAENAGVIPATPTLRDETLVLMGTVIPGFALFEYKPSMRQSIFREGDKIFNRGTLLSVDTLSARVSIEGAVFTYRMGSNKSSPYIQKKVAGEAEGNLKRDMEKSAHRDGAKRRPD